MQTKIAVLIALSFSAPGAFADSVKVWKWIDENGAVVYSADPPPSKTTSAEEKILDPNQNVIEMPAPPPSESPPVSAPTANQVTTRYVVRSTPPPYMPPYPMMNVPYLPPALAMPPSLASRPSAPPAAPRMR